ncbi:uncharacterized protein LOC106525632 [Austrofundulus limnaeus]|uniref:Uncharacterized protein LOC106525632 n=1 Tax=Austrofundulus limnaeus TaxID=52670 RepID=A0A2I4C5X0_AUSLI|nr:PREDICTED: uncharacterized protein LOC106525632 [Austrofundulus limnaeus]
MYTITASLGSSALLPCIFSTTGLSNVTWAQVADDLTRDVVKLASNGRVQFFEHRQDRVKVFPNQASVGNFSISITELNTFDLGSYTCKEGKNCVEVELQEKNKGTLDESAWLLIYFCVGVAVLILLGCVGYYCWVKCPGLWSKRKQDKTEGSENFEGASAPPQEAHQSQMGVDNNRQFYENDIEYLPDRNPVSNHSGPAGDPQHQDQTQPHQSNVGIYPNLNEFRFQRVESRRTRQRFHIELFSRLRQASFNRRHFYVNQHEINRHQAMVAQTQKQKAASLSDCQYQNPIYNQSTEQLNQM